MHTKCGFGGRNETMYRFIFTHIDFQKKYFLLRLTQGATIMFDLNDFKDITQIKGYPSVSVTANGVTFNSATVVKLGKPAYVRLLINEPAKAIAVVPCEEAAVNAVKFYTDKKNLSVRLSGRDLRKTLCDLMEWNIKDGVGYKIDGDFDKNQNAIFFDLSLAKIINEESKYEKPEEVKHSTHKALDI